MMAPAELRADVEAKRRLHWLHVVRECQDACARGGYCREAYLKALDIMEAETLSLQAHERAEKGRAA